MPIYSCSSLSTPRLQSVPSQPSLRPFDIAVALRLLLVPEDRYEPLAAALATSTSAVHRSVARLQQSGLCVRGRRTIVKAAFREFLMHGMRYSFPAVIGAEREGVATATAHPEVARVVNGQNEAAPFVWAREGGSVRGTSLVPLFPGVLEVAARDPRMHELLATVDVLRSGGDGARRAVGDSLASRFLQD